MGAPDEYDWGLTPEAIEHVKADMAVSVTLELDSRTIEAIGLAIKEIE